MTHYRSPYARDTDEGTIDQFDPLGPGYGEHPDGPARAVAAKARRLAALRATEPDACADAVTRAQWRAQTDAALTAELAQSERERNEARAAFAATARQLNAALGDMIAMAQRAETLTGLLQEAWPWVEHAALHYGGLADLRDRITAALAAEVTP